MNLYRNGIASTPHASAENQKQNGNQECCCCNLVLVRPVRAGLDYWRWEEGLSQPTCWRGSGVPIIWNYGFFVFRAVLSALCVEIVFPAFLMCGNAMWTSSTLTIVCFFKMSPRWLLIFWCLLSPPRWVRPQILMLIFPPIPAKLTKCGRGE